MINYLAPRIILFVFFIKGCVGPPDYSDGLLENTPAVINENDYFSLSILGDNYTENKEWDLLISATPTATLLTTLIMKDLNSPVSDSSFYTQNIKKPMVTTHRKPKTPSIIIILTYNLTSDYFLLLPLFFYFL